MTESFDVAKDFLQINHFKTMCSKNHRRHRDMGINQSKDLHSISEFDKKHIPVAVSLANDKQRQQLPNPAPVTESKDEVFDLQMYKSIDEYVLNAPSKLLVGTFDDVIKFMTHVDYWNDMAKSRAIFRWVTSIDIYNLKATETPPKNSPLDFFIKMQTSQGGYAHLIWGLCHMLGIPCVIINGMTKSAAYEIGSKINRENMGAQWNAVYLKGAWRFVDAFWASACVVGRKSKDWKMVDSDGNYVDEDEEDEGVTEHVVNEFYFMTDPEKFIWTHYPDDVEWQLMEKTVSEKDFEEHVYIRERFYSMGIKIEDKKLYKQILIPTEGEVHIQLGIPSERSKDYQFKYMMYRNKTDEDFSRRLLLDKFVLMEHTNTHLKLSLRFPLKGKYKLDVFGLDETQTTDFDLICSYVVQCTEPKKNCLPLPDTPAIGWGPGQETREAGINPKSHQGAIIVTEDGRVDIKLGANKAVEIHQLLKSINIDEATLSKYAVVREENGEHFIHLRLPQGGEYALKIYANDEGKEGNAANVLNYLIRCSNENVENAPFPNIPDGMLGKKIIADEIGVDARIKKGRFKTKDGRIRLEFAAMSHVEILLEIHTQDPIALKYLRAYRQAIDQRWVFDIDLPVKGEYSINVFARENEKRIRIYNVHSYLVFSDGHAYREDKRTPGNPPKVLSETVSTSDNEVLIPVPHGYDRVVACLQRRHANDPPDSAQIEVIEHDGNKLLLTDLPEFGEYLMNIYEVDEYGMMTNIARYGMNRKTTTELLHDDPRTIMDRINEEREDEDETESQTREANETGATIDMVRKRRRILMLKRRAMELGDKEALEQLVKAYEETLPPEDDPTLVSAKKLLNLLNAKDELSAASRTRHLEKLKNAIKRAKEANYDGILNLQIVTAERLKEKLVRIEKLRHNILVMDQSTAAELRTYTHPPDGVRQSIMAVLMLLEYPKRDVKDWKACQNILARTGKESLMRRVAMFDPKYCFLDVALGAKKVIEPFTLEEIRDVSNGAAAFYNWATGMIKEVESTGGASRPMDEWMRVTEDVRGVEERVSLGPASARSRKIERESQLGNMSNGERQSQLGEAPMRMNTQMSINRTYTLPSQNGQR